MLTPGYLTFTLHNFVQGVIVGELHRIAKSGLMIIIITEINLFLIRLIIAVVIILSASGLFGVAFASGIAVSSPIMSAQDTAADTYDIQFDIAWDHSWFITGAPSLTANWDATWIFAKFSIWNAGASTWGAWTHATLSKTIGDYTTPSGSQITVGCSPASACGGADAGKGIFIYRNAVGSGSVSWSGARIRWLYGTDGVMDGDRVRVKLFGIEMVYIPEGSFNVGDDSTAPSGNFTPVRTVNNGSFSDNIIADNTNSGNDDDATIKGGGIVFGDLNAAFPTGYGKFYVMKYEISQRQYAEFLNMLTRTQQASRVAANISADAPDYKYVMSASASVVNRDALSAPASGNGTTDPVVFGCDLDNDGTFDETDDGGWIAAANLDWMDVAAYLAWAGFRPLTELEFEKAARGGQTAVANEYAWGNASIYNSSGASDDYAPTFTGSSGESVSNPGATTGNAAYYETICDKGPNYLCGPVRSGVFAASAATKDAQETGGSYYGVMGLSGNMWERVVTIGNNTGRAFDGSHGSGALSASGNAVQSAWPGYDGAAVTGAAGSGFRGGAWISLTNSLRVSDRDYASVATTLRAYVYGGRGARTAQ